MDMTETQFSSIINYCILFAQEFLVTQLPYIYPTPARNIGFVGRIEINADP